MEEKKTQREDTSTIMGSLTCSLSLYGLVVRSKLYDLHIHVSCVQGCWEDKDACVMCIYVGCCVSPHIQCMSFYSACSLSLSLSSVHVFTLHLSLVVLPANTMQSA